MTIFLSYILIVTQIRTTIEKDTEKSNPASPKSAGHDFFSCFSAVSKQSIGGKIE